ncbi:VRR-NUC domain-containing protein [Vibrio sp. ABG19]|uniref:VRR-NUC domain-containing protein n=1 Tax=Vibrio sp. ABG19 TaxID=2817385 RepID=UPI00249F7518|nr:VRR-NUC domain-containing protein [Vibrio sp. ABG19]WGY44947.1 VRR-NUC domain-containing protein [Vibrio sp. ABG19]
MQPLPVLPDDYYLTNFHKLLSHALEWYADLLRPAELEWCHDFHRLSHDAQCMLVRLLSRKGQWFRSDKLNYAEISHQANALNELARAGFISLNPELDAVVVARELLTKADIVTLYPQLGRSLRKPQLIEALKVAPIENVPELNFDIIHLNQSDIIELLLILFFANTRQTFAQFVLDDLGLNNFESYPLSKERCFFQTRQQVDHLFVLRRIQAHYDAHPKPDETMLDKLLSQLPQPGIHAYIERRRQHQLNQIARDYERQQCLDKALAIYQQTEVIPSRERQARIYEKLEQTQPMRDVVETMFAQPLNYSEYEIALKLHKRLLRLEGHKVARESKPVYPTRQLQLDLTQQRVELAVKQQLESEGYQVYYLENQFLNTLFGLTFWDAIFAPVEGAFINRYQYRPLDLYHSDFVSKRKFWIEQAITRLRNEGVMPLWALWQTKFSLANPFVFWAGWDKTLFELTDQCIEPDILAGLFEIMLSDLKLYRNGMPDLIAFKEGQFEWIEVKGPGDKLQDNQWRWMARFEQLKVPFSVCYVNH